MSTTLDEDRVRRKAHEIWESEGRPDGRSDSHWQQAREIVALKDSYGSTLTPVANSLEQEAEPAVAFENQGEFPGLTDMGDGARGPSWQAARATTDEDDADPDNTVPSQGTRA
ncbi:DUF2934 domain-containing protein [Aureimonas flava]|uniref:DUF2934 domain-containing protein n=1 Tax=Aureimonas flava TaxID=2320271 RepID=A0A3A1WRQ0_9HYPH|nr:DUF2934 domain-containing protein [Aureimonas flava]RIY03241.1 DUF2934 domain-containing protein [Aureimonas flava]